MRSALLTYMDAHHCWCNDDVQVVTSIAKLTHVLSVPADEVLDVLRHHIDKGHISYEWCRHGTLVIQHHEWLLDDEICATFAPCRISELTECREACELESAALVQEFGCG